MKASGSITICAVLLANNLAVAVVANANTRAVSVSQSTVTVSTDADGGQVQSTTVSVDQADLTQPHILRVEGLANNSPIRMQKVVVKINGKIVKSITNNSLQLNLAPMMKVGSYKVEISGNSPRSDDTISVNFTGKNTNVTQQSSGTGIINQTLVINVQ